MNQMTKGILIGVALGYFGPRLVGMATAKAK